MRWLSPLALGVAVLVLAGCGGGTRSKKAVADSRVGRVFYLCCNLHYDPKKPQITDGGPMQGTLLPFATRVEVQKVTGDSVLFQAAGHPPITLDYEHGGKAQRFDQYLSLLFVTDDPRLKLKKVPARQVKQVEKGSVVAGMTRDQVIMALGYPPADRTPSLEAASWSYASGAFTVYFDGNRVSAVQRGGSRSRR